MVVCRYGETETVEKERITIISLFPNEELCYLFKLHKAKSTPDRFHTEASTSSYLPELCNLAEVYLFGAAVNSQAHLADFRCIEELALLSNHPTFKTLHTFPKM